MKKSFFLLVAMVATSAGAQQNVDITAEQFNSGAANAQLTALGRKAAASGKRLIVTAPQHWHARIASSIRAGGKADIVLKDGFYENLLVRVEDKDAKPAKPEPKTAPVAAAPRPAPAPVETRAPPSGVAATPPTSPARPVVETQPPAAAPAPAPVAESPTPEPDPAASEASVASAESEARATLDPKAPIMLVAAEPSATDPLREFMEKRYNEGKRIVESVEPNKLERGDVLYIRKGAAVVIRRDRRSMLRLWLVGSLNLNQIGLGADGVNKYKVLNSIIE